MNICSSGPQTKEELTVLRGAMKFATCLSGNIAWSQVQHRFCLPAAACVLLAEEPWQREEGRKISQTCV